MSPLFVRKFRTGIVCQNCKGPRDSHRLMCRNHLLIARLAWRVWAAGRRAAGVCDACNRREVLGTGRCPAHRAANLTKVRAWHKAHPRYWVRYATQNRAFIQAGKCPKCAEHRTLDGKHTRCGQCRKYHRLTQGATELSKAERRRHHIKLISLRRASLAERTAKQVAYARAQLASLGFEARNLLGGGARRLAAT